MSKPIIYHIPVCPFSQRVEILLALKGMEDSVQFETVDITKPRPDWLLKLTDGTTAMPVMDLGGGRVLKESLVILRWVEETFSDRLVARSDPFERGVERLMITREGPFTASGYIKVMNTDRAKTDALRDTHLEHYAWLDAFLTKHNPDGPWLFDDFGLAETVFTPMFKRFWFLEYYEGFEIPRDARYDRVRRWRDACMAHPATQQVSFEEIVTQYYDYAVGAGNGALPDGRSVSSFSFAPRWDTRPLPPKDKYDRIASDAELGLI